ALMLLSALPWMLAGGMFGPLAGATLAFFAGVLRYLWDTHSIFTPLELTLLAILFSVAARQRYRTLLFKGLRHPLAAAAFLSAAFALLFLYGASLNAPGSLASRLDYALTGLPGAWLALTSELFIAALFAQVAALAFPAQWGRHLPLQPSPSERSLAMRFLFGVGALVLFLLGGLLMGSWVIAGNVARNLLQERMKDTAEITAGSVPFFLETGQGFAQQIAADPRLTDAAAANVQSALARHMQTVTYFEQLMVLDENASLLAAYPPDLPPAQQSLFPEESAALGLAFKNVLSQSYTIPPVEFGSPARVSFIAAIVDESGRPVRVLVARAGIDTNPIIQPVLDGLRAVAAMEGTGMLIDENNRILYHPSPDLVMTEYRGLVSPEPSFYDGTAPDGTRSLVYYQPVEGRAWSVVLTVPARRAQQTALNIAAPLSVMILILGALSLVGLRIGLGFITASLQNLSNEAVRISQGQLDRPLSVDSVDEIGQLRRAFEQMRISLQARLEELNRLLIVSQGVASSLDMQDAVQPVLEAVLPTGASAVRVVLAESDVLEGFPREYALGPFREAYAHLDAQILDLMRKQDRLALSHLSRSRILQAEPGRPMPTSILAVPLRYESRYYGALWAAYDQMRNFSESDVRFITTLGGQAALAASNTLLFLTAEAGRQRLAAILASTPDPVLVTDAQNHLLLSNPAATDVLGMGLNIGQGKPVEQVLTHKALVEILTTESDENLSAEVTLADGKTYLATASPVEADGRLVGRVCILRDVTHFKELDMMKSEFVNTVSHDLRSPLTLMRGYATMLEMVGDLNEQQKTYVSKIITGVENMARLVNNLLDLGRIEVGVGLRLETAPLADIIERVTTSLQMNAAQKTVEFTVEKPDTLPMIEADPALLQQAIYNLAENAIKYTPAGGKVTLRFKIRGAEMLYEVQDTGIGIAPADQPRLFEKFYRGSQREARQEKGSGLGLAIVKSIVEKHGGKVWLESQLGKGSTFYMQIPLQQPKTPDRP
ncbi:MAG: ATP-binding protein, partial [Anaerolineales bacterium]